MKIFFNNQEYEVQGEVTELLSRIISNNPTILDGIQVAGGSVLEETITQTSHGLSLLDSVYHNGSEWVKAKADTGTTLGSHVVTEYINADSFKITTIGKKTVTAHGLTPNNYYFTSDVTAGLLVTTEPTSVTSYSNPMLFVLDANNIYILNWRPSIISAGNLGSSTSEIKWEWPAGFMLFPTTRPATLNTRTLTNGESKEYLFAYYANYSGNDQGIVQKILMPSDLTGLTTINIDIIVSAVSDPGAGTNCSFYFSHSTAGDTEDPDVAWTDVDSGDIALTDWGSSNAINYKTWTVSLLTAGWAANDQVRIKFSRKATSGTDFTGTVGLSIARVRLT
jgi:hypothetical protein